MSTTLLNHKSLRKLCKGSKNIELIDVRTPVEYREVHVDHRTERPLDQLDVTALMKDRNGFGQRATLRDFVVLGDEGQQACEKFHKRASQM